ncbi:helix-turn-helix domain-containing protein [Actinomadura atramentaria]|uniref:helix-turn-helix domain-containing protein n=1 Tax=Actinomadura atramentaria TaxID=1990 RepID=UPI0004767DEA|nr:XRE family transcriptional regulator [Actinomadura atramentaria]
MLVEAKEIGRRIADARGRAGFTQADLAQEIALDRSALAKIETGDRRVTALELARIAQAVGARIEWFVEQAPEAIVSRRNRQEPGAPSPRIDQWAERVARAVEFTVGSSLGGVPAETMPTDRNEAERLAAKARRLLGAAQDGPLPDLAEHVAEIGLLAFSFDLGVDSADAATVLLRSGGIAIVNGASQVGRRRLALAHELGHYLVADEYTVDWRIAEQTGAERRESLLDRFARALLLPADSLRRDWAKSADGPTGDPRAAAVRVASAYRVDMATLSRRLSELGIIDGTAAGRVRAVRTTRADIVEHGLVVADELAPPALPRAYERAVLRLYRQEDVSAARALDLLFDTWDEPSLPQLPQRPEHDIWQFVQ